MKILLYAGMVLLACAASSDARRPYPRWLSTTPAYTDDYGMGTSYYTTGYPRTSGYTDENGSSNYPTWFSGPSGYTKGNGMGTSYYTTGYPRTSGYTD